MLLIAFKCFFFLEDFPKKTTQISTPQKAPASWRVDVGHAIREQQNLGGATARAT